MNYHTILLYGFWGLLFAGAMFCMTQIAIADWRRRIIPDAFLWPLMLAGMIAAAFLRTWPIDAAAAAVGGAFGYALAAMVGFGFDYKIRKKNPDAAAPIGLGDIKLIATGGIWLGTTGLAVALIIACATGGIWSIRTKQRYIPFAPFFAIGGILSLLGLLILL